MCNTALFICLFDRSNFLTFDTRWLFFEVVCQIYEYPGTCISCWTDTLFLPSYLYFVLSTMCEICNNKVFKSVRFAMDTLPESSEAELQIIAEEKNKMRKVSCWLSIEPISTFHVHCRSGRITWYSIFILVLYILRFTFHIILWVQYLGFNKLN